MKLQSCLGALLVALLCSCGGGDPGQDRPADSATPSRLAAAAPLQVPHAAFTADRFVAWAESHYPQLFNGSVVTGTAGVYHYRYYAATGNYLAVGEANDLYALGAPTNGQILNIGSLDRLACFVYPANCAPSADVGATAGTAAVFDLLAGAASQIDASGDRDWFGVDLTAGVTYTFDLEGAPTAKGTLPDPYLTLYSATGAWLAENDDVAYPANVNARITYTPTATGRYYLEASAFTGTGTYQLTATASGGATAISGASNPSALAQAMGTTAYSITFDTYIYYVQLDPTLTNVTAYVCNAGTTPTCGSRTVSFAAGNPLANLSFDTKTLSLSMLDANVTLQPTTDAPANFAPAQIDPCTIHPTEVVWSGFCPTPVQLTGGWAGSWSWTGVNRGCTFTNGGAFTMSVTQSSSGSVSGSGSAAGVQTRDSSDCHVADTTTEFVSVGGTATSGSRSTPGSAQLQLDVGGILYLANGQFDGQQFTGTVTRDAIGGSGTITLTKQ